MRNALAFFAVTLASLGLCSAASAEGTVQYSITCISSSELCDNFYDNGTMIFSLPQFPTPDKIFPNDAAFSFDNLPFTVDGTSNTFTEVDFFSPKGLGLDTSIPTKEGQTLFVLAGGPQIFQGSVRVPQLVPGDFSFFANLAGPGGPAGKAHLEVIATLEPEPGSPIPEPATWTMMISGLAILGIVRRLAWRRSHLASTRAFR
jgi:hypothetical protein